MKRYIAHSERYARGRIEVWRRTGAEPWFVTILPDPGENDYPGHTYTRARNELPAAVPDDADALMAWAWERVQATDT